MPFGSKKFLRSPVDIRSTPRNITVEKFRLSIVYPIREAGSIALQRVLPSLCQSKRPNM
jgi:hypothetical protein